MPPPSAPDAAGRFHADLAGLIGAAGPAPLRLGVAVSGGPDSLALLLLARAALGAAAVAAATVDHRLRPEAADEARAVAGICAALDVPHSVLTPARPIAGNLQAGARAARYALLAGWARASGIALVATAHHADDQAETLLMRLNRGAGVGGLAGVRASRMAGTMRIIRPLLGWRRAELAAVVAAAGLDPVDDPSNHDDRFDRVRLRRTLAEAGWLDVPALARSAAALAEADAALGWTAERLRDSHVAPDGDALTLDPALPAELRRRLVAALLAELGDAAAPPRGPDLDRFLASLAAGGTATLAGVKGSGGARWRLSPAPARRTGASRRRQDHCS